MADLVGSASVHPGLGDVVRRPVVTTVDRGLAYLSERNLLVPGVAASLGLGNMALLGIPVHWPVLLVLFCATYVVYVVDRHPTILLRPVSHLRLVAVLCTMFLTGLAALWCLSAAGRVVVACLGLLSFGYVYPVLPGRRRLKDVPFAKPFLVTVGWVAGCVGLPALEAGMADTGLVVALGVYRFGYLFPNLLLSDWPDRATDEGQGIRTWALRLRAPAMVRLCWGVIVTVGCGGAVAVLLGLMPVVLLVDVAGLLLLLPLLWEALPDEKQPFQNRLDAVLVWPLATWLTVGLLSWAFSQG